ncbi:MAG TPA: hypothetical protein VLA96_14110 [Terriglobales bacterium]|nr:hypothetical protein [Terriglobales bacterium]
MRRLALAFVTIVAVLGCAGLALRAQERGGIPRASVRSPHGPLAIRCENCHTFTGWKPIRAIPEFDHDKTRYPLRGMHAKVGCMQCHASLVFTDVGKSCSACHADIHRGQNGKSCERCHTVNGWRVSIDDIQKHFNRFPLTGGHSTAQCGDCHKSAAAGVFPGLSTVCYSCHAKDAKSAPVDHSAFPTDCTACHSMDTWLGAKFDHLRFTGFALTGTHATLDCAACHVNNRFKGTPANCFACHAREFNATTNPNHVQAKFPQDCAICHSTATWLDAKFDHARFTSFPLTGGHANLNCNSCHANGNFSGTPTDCASCHLKDYNATTNPNHVTAGFPKDCSICHATTAWTPASFDHSKTGFALTGAHSNLTCATCHVNGNYSGLSSACSSCHQKQYDATTNPNHKAAGFPTDCAVCHSTSAWTPASFNHSLTGFTLTGAHVNTPCTSCHINNQFAGTPTDCYACHKAAFTSTTNPNHVAAAFPTTCQTCHNTTTWSGATFNHTWFPIYSGTHAGKWTSCADCHTNSSNFAVFSCITCHTHDRAQTDPHHTGVSGYSYTPTSCYTCHRNGTAD